MPLRTIAYPMMGWLALLGLLAGCDDGGSHRPPPPSPAPEVLAVTSPVRLAPYDAASLLVTDYNTNKLLIIDKTTLLPTGGFSVNGRPSGVASADGRIFVGNQLNHSVDVYDPRGRLLYYLGGRPMLFEQINDLAIDPVAGLVYALDTMAARIKVFNLDGSSAGPDIGAGLLQHPTALAVNSSNGNLLVSDFGVPSDPQVRIFDIAGSQIGSIVGVSGGWFSPTTVFSTPQGLFADTAGYLYLVDALSSEVLIYHLQTKSLVKKLGSLGTGPEQLMYPLDACLDEGNRDVFVADNRNGRITVFRGGGVTP